MNYSALCLLLMAPAAAGDGPPVTHFDATALPPSAITQGESATLALSRVSDERLTVPVRLGASRHYRFLVDTGSERTTVSSELAQELGLEEGPKATLHSTSGESLVRMTRLPDLSMDRRIVRNIRAPMLSARNIGADGILGIDSLRSQRVVFDFAAGRLAILAGAAPAVEDRDTIVVRARPRDGRLIITDARVDGQRVSVVLDTGSALTVGNLALRRKLERRGGLSPMGAVDLISVTGATLRSQLAGVRSLDIGGARLENLPVAFVDAHTFRQLGLQDKPAVLLGMNGFKGFDQVTIDFGNRTISLVLPKARKPLTA